MMRVATDAQQQRLHLPIRMMSGRQWTEQRKFTIKIKWKFDEMFTIFSSFVCVYFKFGPNYVREKGLQKTSHENVMIEHWIRFKTPFQLNKIIGVVFICWLLKWLLVCYCHICAQKLWREQSESERQKIRSLDAVQFT